ncbi:MAG: YggS family pyridoxal phosphate-dependent enzyme [Tissierellia bacterium]|nr:YggS family pyridoxal phosphate-dependent enzyme [Tissierellia bacterium]
MMKQRLETLLQDLENKEEKLGRPISLVAVSKFYSLEKIEESIGYGVKAIGENKAQEFLEKAESLLGKVQLHFIGHVQRNKVRQILPYVDLIHSVDSLRLLKEIQKQAKRLNKIQEILLQVNIAKEEQKYGFLVEELDEALAVVDKSTNVKVVGMMMMAPFSEDPEEVRVYFKEMSVLFDLYKEKHYNNVDMGILSMGMSGDYEVAIEEGSTMVRIGSAIYKEEE